MVGAGPCKTRIEVTWACLATVVYRTANKSRVTVPFIGQNGDAGSRSRLLRADLADLGVPETNRDTCGRVIGYGLRGHGG